MELMQTVVGDVVREGILVIIRLGLGLYRLEGEGRNILVPESRVGWGTVANELSREGYRLVTPEEYATDCGVPAAEVQRRIERGEVFVLRYGAEELIACSERQVREDLGPLPL